MSNKHQLPRALQHELRALANEISLAEAARRVGISRQTYAILAAGLPANATTVLGVTARLEQLFSERREAQ